MLQYPATRKPRAKLKLVVEIMSFLSQNQDFDYFRTSVISD